MQIIYYKKSKIVLACISAFKIYFTVRYNLDKKRKWKWILLQMTRLFMQNGHLTVSFTIAVSLLIYVISGVSYLLYMVLTSFGSHCNTALSLIFIFMFPLPSYNSNFEADQSKISPHWIGVEMNLFIHFTHFYRVPIMCQPGTRADKNP